MRTFLGAVSFLTNIRVTRHPAPPGRAAVFFPLIGAILGAAGAGIFLAASRVFPSSLAALLTVVFWALIAGVVHEGRIGYYSAAAVLISSVARWQVVEHLAVSNLFAVFIASQAVPRAAMVVLAWVSRPAESGLGLELSSTLTTTVAIAAMVQGFAVAFACGVRPGVLIAIASYLVIRVARWYSYRRMGGVNADCMGGVEQILEILILALFTVIRD